jgi:hypothetical protein
VAHAHLRGIAVAMPVRGARKVVDFLRAHYARNDGRVLVARKVVDFLRAHYARNDGRVLVWKSDMRSKSARGPVFLQATYTPIRQLRVFLDRSKEYVVFRSTTHAGNPTMVGAPKL